MRNTVPDRPHLSDGAEAPAHQAPPAVPRHSRLSHHQARGRLALLLDAATEPELAGQLRQHVAGCARCQQELEQLRQAEAWLLAQPVEVPQMRAVQQATWKAIQERIAAADAEMPVPTVEKSRSNGHAPELCPPASTEASALVPLAAESADAERSETDADRLYHPLPVPQPPAPVTISFPPFGKPGALRPYRVLIVALAASFIVGSFAALFLVHLSAGSLPSEPTPTPLFSMDVLDPGSETPNFSFDPVSRRLLALTGEMSYPCLGSCPYFGPDCLHFAMLDVGTGKALSTLRPTCTPGKSTLGSTTFTSLLDDSAAGEALLIGSDQQVTAVDNRSGAVVRQYALACCTSDYDQQPGTLLDQRDQLLLTAAQSGVAGVPDKVVAQNATTGQLKYQTTLRGTDALRGALVSDVTGWLYVWSQCAMYSSASCIDVYQAGSGQRVTAWETASLETPLAADPTADVLYVRADQSNGQSATLVVDGHSGATVGQLPAAQAMAINAPLHHAYLLDDNGVTVVDTQTRRKLSTLPVLARDESWVAPAVDAAANRVYLPIQRGKLLMAQDDAAGQLHLRSAQLSAVLAAERAMSVKEAKRSLTLYPWELPVGPGSFTVYHPFSRGTPGNCEIGWVAARSTAAISAQGGGQYTVKISLAWDDQFARGTLSDAPTPQASYPHQHSWLYRVPASGAAWLSSEQGEGWSTLCQAAAR